MIYNNEVESGTVTETQEMEYEPTVADAMWDEEVSDVLDNVLDMIYPELGDHRDKSSEMRGDILANLSNAIEDTMEDLIEAKRDGRL